MRLYEKFLIIICLVIGAHMTQVAATIQSKPSVFHGRLGDTLDLGTLTAGMDSLKGLDPDFLLEEGVHEHLYNHLVTAFQSIAEEHKDKLLNWDIDQLLQMDTSLTEGSRAELKSAVGSLDDTVGSVLPILSGDFPAPRPHRHKNMNPYDTLRFVIRANRDVFGDDVRVSPVPSARNTFRVKTAGSDKLLYLRHRGTVGGFEWSPKGHDTCFAWLKTHEPPCWFNHRSDLPAKLDLLIKKLIAHENIPAGISAEQVPSGGEITGALAYGLFNGIFMGMGDYFRDALLHPDCDNVAEVLKPATKAFGHALKVSGRCVVNIVTLKKGTKACAAQPKLWKDALAAFRPVAQKCATLRRNIGLLVVILLVALVAFKVAGAVLGSVAGPVGTAIGATLGLAAKLVMIVFAVGSGLSFMFRSVRNFVQAARRCRNSACVKPDVITMLESGAGFVGVWIGIICLSGIQKVIEFPKFRALFTGARPRFNPKFLGELDDVGRAWQAARGGKKIPTTGTFSTVVDDAAKGADDVTKQADDIADDVAKQADDVTDDVAKQADDVTDDVAKQADDVTDDVAKQADDVTDDVAKNADDAAKKASEIEKLDSEIAKARRDVEYWQKKHGDWKPSPQKDYIRMEHVGDGKFAPKNYGKPAQYNPHRNSLSDAQSKLRKLVTKKQNIITPPKPVPVPVKDPWIHDIIKKEKQLSKLNRDFAYFKRTSTAPREGWLTRIQKVKDQLAELRSHPQPKNSLPRGLERVFAQDPSLRTAKGTTSVSWSEWSGTIKDGVPVDLIKKLGG